MSVDASFRGHVRRMSVVDDVVKRIPSIRIELYCGLGSCLALYCRRRVSWSVHGAPHCGGVFLSRVRYVESLFSRLLLHAPRTDGLAARVYHSHTPCTQRPAREIWVGSMHCKPTSRRWPGRTCTLNAKPQAQPRPRAGRPAVARGVGRSRTATRRTSDSPDPRLPIRLRHRAGPEPATVYPGRSFTVTRSSCRHPRSLGRAVRSLARV